MTLSFHAFSAGDSVRFPLRVPFDFLDTLRVDLAISNSVKGNKRWLRKQQMNTSVSDLNRFKLDAMILGSKLRYWLLTLVVDERIYVVGHVSAILINAGIETGRTLVENLAGFNVGALVEFSEAISQRPEVFPRLRSLA